jgi:hypothetical protein
MRWLLVFLIAFLLFNGLQGWLRRIGLGRCRATCAFACAAASGTCRWPAAWC